jgi:hypothetical protein
MNDRKPICFYFAVSYPALLFCYFLFCAIFIHEPYPYGPNEGGLPANFGIGLIVAALFVIFYFIGLIMIIASLVRGEKFRNFAWTCLAIYLLPALVPVLYFL